MPIENEKKYVLHTESANDLMQKAEKILNIKQGYYNDIRLRQQDESYWFTFKKRINDEVLEIETRIDETDYNRLAPFCSNWVTKKRLKIEDWDVDLFYYPLYIIVAEIEYETKPPPIPFFISSALLYEVPEEDRRFSSKRLSDIHYARRLLGEIRRSTEFVVA